MITWQPTAAMKFSQDRVAIGVGLQINRGDIFVDQVRLVDNPYPYPLNVRPYDKFVELYSVDGYGFGVGFNLGVQFKVSPKVTIGANYVSASKFTMNGDSKERFYLPYNEGIARLYDDPQSNAYQKEVNGTYRGAMIGNTGEFEVEMKLPSEFGAAPAEHRILLFWFVRLAAEQGRIFVGLEVGEAHDDRSRSEGGGDLRDAVGEIVNIEINRILPSGGLLRDGGAQFRRKLFEIENGERMDADVGGDDEFLAREPDARDRQEGFFKGDVRRGDVHHDLRLRFPAAYRWSVRAPLSSPCRR